MLNWVGENVKLLREKVKLFRGECNQVLVGLIRTKKMRPSGTRSRNGTACKRM
jgi:hypothetical protein